MPRYSQMDRLIRMYRKDPGAGWSWELWRTDLSKAQRMAMADPLLTVDEHVMPGTKALLLEWVNTGETLIARGHINYPDGRAMIEYAFDLIEEPYPEHAPGSYRFVSSRERYERKVQERRAREAERMRRIYGGDEEK